MRRPTSTSPGLWQQAVNAISSPIISAPITQLFRHGNNEPSQPVINLGFDPQQIDSIVFVPYNSDDESDPDTPTDPKLNPVEQAAEKPKPGLEVKKQNRIIGRQHNNSSDLGPWGTQAEQHLQFRCDLKTGKVFPISPPISPRILSQREKITLPNITLLKSFIQLKAHYDFLHAQLHRNSHKFKSTRSKEEKLLNKVNTLREVIKKMEEKDAPDTRETEIENTLKQPRNFIGHIKNFLHARFGIFKPVTSWYLYTELLKEIKNQTQTTPAP